MTERESLQGLRRIYERILQVAEAYGVAVVLTLFFLALGNLGSVYYPRPVNAIATTSSMKPTRESSMYTTMGPRAASRRVWTNG